jgi:hypothetical protein
MAEAPAALIHPSRIPNRWIQLTAGIVAMMAIANLQYAWTLFTKPIQAISTSRWWRCNGLLLCSSLWKPGSCRLKGTW